MAVEKERFAGSDKKVFVVSKAGGINTQSPREAIGDDEFSWLENLQPIADGNYRAMYSNGSAVYTTSNPRTIIYRFFYNIGATNYAAVFLDDGSAVQINLGNNATTTIAGAGSFYPGSVALGTPLPQAAQFGQSGIVIVSTAGVGFAFWDGALFYTSGTIGPTVTLTAGGSGYQSAPFVTFSGGSGTGAVAFASINKGAVTGITVTNPGSGYQLGDTINVTLTGGTSTGSGAALTAVLTHNVGGTGAVLTPNFAVSITYPNIVTYVLNSITVANGGSGYSPNATSAWNNPPGRGNPSDNQWVGTAINGGRGPSVTLTVVGGVITGATAVGQGNVSQAGWDTLNGSPQFPTLTVSDSGYYAVTSVTVTSGGSGYSPSTTVVASGGGSPTTQATLKPVIASGVITSVTVINGGVYGTNTPPTLTVNDNAVTATATAELMPFGTSGTCVETFSGRIWIGNGATIQFNSPGGDVANWDVAKGAGAFGSTDSFLRQRWIALKQSSSFLYLFADSSINVISNVQSSGSPVVTTFNNQNVDPQIGTPWRDSVVAMYGKVLFGNTIGVFDLEGGRVTKVSDALDGVFAAANSTLLAVTSLTEPSGAAMTINQQPIYMMVVPVQGPLDNSPRTALVLWDEKRWWIGSQATTFTQVATQEINSVLQAWGNSTTTINKLFNTASGSLAKTWQTKLWSAEGPHIVKQAMRLYTMAIDKSSGGYTFTGTYDYRLEGTAVLTQSFTTTDVSLTGSGSINANIRGSFLGYTMTTTKNDFILLGQGLLYQEQSPLP